MHNCHSENVYEKLDDAFSKNQLQGYKKHQSQDKGDFLYSFLADETMIM